MKLTYSYPPDLPADADEVVNPEEMADLRHLVGQLALSPDTVPATVQAVVVQKSFAGLDYKAEGRAYLLEHCPETLNGPAVMRAARHRPATAEHRYRNA